MGRFKNIEIEGLLIMDFEKVLVDSVNRVIETSDLGEEEILKKLTPKFDELLSMYEESTSSLYVEHHKFNLQGFLKTHFNNQQKIAKTHQESFVGFILYLNGCFNIYEKIIEKLKRKKVDNTLKIAVALYGLVIRRADQILNQLLNGYIDGSMIIWRSLYENATILLLLAIENDNDLSVRYLHHSTRNSKRKILSYQKHYKELSFDSLNKSTEKKLQIEIDKLNIRYGKDFLDNEYGWADHLFNGKQKANFMLIEERAKMSRFRPYYIWCCEQVHSNFNGFRMFMDKDKIVLPFLISQEIELDAFIDPMQFTVSVLQEINEFILYEFSVEKEYNVNVLLMKKVFEKQQNTFVKSKRKTTL